MCPIPYYDLMRHSQAKTPLRLEMVRYAAAHGVKPAARVFHTTPKTVRKWLRRWDKRSLASLADHSRAPHAPARRITAAQRDTVCALKHRLPSWGAARMKRDFQLPLSEKAIARIWREAGLQRPRRRKHRTKQDLRAVKATWRLFEQSGVDTKDLDDIPAYYTQMRAQRLPTQQYTFREVVSGLQFLAFAQERSLIYATCFINRILAHLAACGVDLAECRVQSDNGSEFIGAWNARHASSVTRAIEAHRAVHCTIPPGAHTWQADVETVHRLIEDECYHVETFASRQDFLAKLTTYQYWFNTGRRNRSKQGKTPWDILHERDPTLHPRIALLPPVFLDELWQHQQQTRPTGGDDVIPYPLLPYRPSHAPVSDVPQWGVYTTRPCRNFRPGYR